MKRKVLLFFLLACFLCGSEVFPEMLNSCNKPYVTSTRPYYQQYYNFDLTNLTAKFVPLSQTQEKNLTGISKDNYKKIKKIEGYISSNNYDKALKTDNNYLPLHVYYYNYYINKNDYHSAMNQLISIKRINSVDKVFNDDIISYKLGMLYYIEKNYSSALTYLSNFINVHNPSEENLWFVLGDIYFNLNNFDRSIEFLTKIPAKSINYEPAQEVLFNDYYSLRNFDEASKCAEYLVKRNPSSQNLIRRAATMKGDDNTKLYMLERARTLALTSSNYTDLIRADAGIARIEQKKIDDAVNKLSGFVVKPDWQKIMAEAEPYTDVVELSNRQSNFFNSTNNCIRRFNGNDLIKCFEYVNQQEDKITNEKKLAYQREYEEQLREYDIMQRQQEFLERTYYNRLYMDEFYYMRAPYNYFFWW